MSSIRRPVARASSSPNLHGPGLAALILGSVALSACGGHDDLTCEGGATADEHGRVLALVGDWVVSNPPTHYHISSTSLCRMDWAGTDLYALTSFDNDQRWTVGRTTVRDESDLFEWVRFEWTYDGVGARYLCQTVDRATTEADAEGPSLADGTDLRHGCPGRAWEKLARD